MDALVAAHLGGLLGVHTEAQLLALSAWTMAALGVAAFAALLWVEAPYGKYAGQAHWLYGPPVNGRLAWLLQEAPSFAVAAAMWRAAAAASGGSLWAAPNRVDLAAVNANTVLLAMYLLHYFNRSFVYPLRLRGSKPTPLVIMLMALAFCMWNGWMQGRHLAAHATFPPGYIASPRFVAGAALFFCGMAVNWHSDGVLIALRRPGESGYKIPRGGAFELVSGANFLGEIVEWAGFALAANSLPAAVFALFTFCNIAPRGASHHRWYQRQFKDYPPHRRAVIPFLW